VSNVYLGGSGGGGTGLTQAQVDARVLVVAPTVSNNHWGEVPANADLVTLTDAERGDTAVTADTGDTWRLMGADPTVLADWENQTPVAHDPFMTDDLFLTP